MTALPSRLKSHILLWLSIATPLLISGPLAMFGANYADFDLGAQQLAILTAPLLISSCGLALITALLPLQRFWILLLTWLAVGLYVQGNFLVWDYGRFDGTSIPWEELETKGYIDVAGWLAILVIVIATRDKIISNLTPLLTALCLLQVGTSTVSFMQSKAPLRVAVSQTAGTSLYSFSKERNVLILLMDEFSSRGFYQILQKTPELKRDLADFTFYRDTLAAFPTTYAAVPAILTGQPAPLTDSMSAYFEATAPTSLNEQFAQAGWSSEVVTIHPICKSFKRSACQSLDQAVASDKGTAATNQLLKLLDLTLFRYSPHFLKKKIYDDSHWFLQNIGRVSPPPIPAGEKNYVQYSVTPSQELTFQFVDSFITRLSVDSATPSFKLLHLMVPHGPYTTNAECGPYVGPRLTGPNRYLNQGLCGMKLAKKIFAKLKEQGVYDSTTIIIVADHGTPLKFDFDEFGTSIDKKLRRAFPLLLVKPAGQSPSPSGELAIDPRPLSQLELLRIVNDIEKLNFIVPETHARTPEGARMFRNYSWSHADWSSDVLPPVKTFEVTGDSWRVENWKEQAQPRPY